MAHIYVMDRDNGHMKIGFSTEEIRDRSGLSIKTLYTELGRRGAAQERAKKRGKVRG